MNSRWIRPSRCQQSHQRPRVQMLKPTPRLCSNRRCAIGKDDHLVVGNLHVAALDFVALHGAALCRRQADLAISQHGHQRSATGQ